ncbi:response regulator [bacterium]|nr:response regulator [bacterium]
MEEKENAEENRILRRKTQERAASTPDEGKELDASDEMQQILHELQVHQIELEIQNEELRYTQESLLVAQARYFDLYDMAPVGYLTLNQQGIILETNLTGARLLGTARSLLPGQPFTQHILPEDQDIYYHFRRLLTKKETSQQCEVRLRHPAAEPTWVHLNGAMKPEEPDGILTLRITLSDITALKQAEEKLSNNERNMAETQRLNMIGQLAGGIAHEFNNALAVILLRTEMTLLLVEQDGKAHRNLVDIHATVQQSANLVRQLLGFARKQIIKPIPLNLNEVITNIQPMLTNLLGAQIELFWQPDDSPCLLDMDPAQIEQVLVNLCINARDAIAGKGKVTIEVAKSTATEVDQPEALAPGEYIILTVSDSGQGIDKEVMAHIFEPFFTTKAIGKGVGLGLSMVQGVILQNRGKIEVFSQPGQGATFRIFLPRLVGAHQPKQMEQPSASLEQPKAPSRQGERTVLLVEDSPLLLESVAEFLEYQGYTVLSAVTPKEALAYAEGFPGVIHLLLTDIVLPDMNGPEMAALVLALRPQVQVLYTSGYSVEAVASRGVQISKSHFLQKPYTLADLAAKLSEILPVGPD